MEAVRHISQLFRPTPPGGSVPQVTVSVRNGVAAPAGRAKILLITRTGESAFVATHINVQHIPAGQTAEINVVGHGSLRLENFGDGRARIVNNLGQAEDRIIEVEEGTGHRLINIATLGLGGRDIDLSTRESLKLMLFVQSGSRIRFEFMLIPEANALSPDEVDASDCNANPLPFATRPPVLVVPLEKLMPGLSNDEATSAKFVSMVIKIRRLAFHSEQRQPTDAIWHRRLFNLSVFVAAGSITLMAAVAGGGIYYSALLFLLPSLLQISGIALLLAMLVRSDPDNPKQIRDDLEITKDEFYRLVDTMDTEQISYAMRGINSQPLAAYASSLLIQARKTIN
ncbi:MAG: hypothetical protein WC901_06775 [Candidatus Margulisiibacteriota bacterium]